MADLTPADVKNVTDQINQYADEVESLAKANGIDTSVSGNDPGELTKAAATGAAAGAGGAAAFAAAAGPFAPAVVAAGAVIGAIAGFLAKFRFGPSPEAIALTKEFGELTGTIEKIMEAVPQPYRDQIALQIIRTAKGSPGPFPFCLQGGGCAMVSIQGLRDTAATLNDMIKARLAAATAPEPLLTPRRVGAGLLVAGLIGFGVYLAREKRK